MARHLKPSSHLCQETRRKPFLCQGPLRRVFEFKWELVIPRNQKAAHPKFFNLLTRVEKIWDEIKIVSTVFLIKWELLVPRILIDSS